MKKRWLRYCFIFGVIIHVALSAVFAEEINFQARIEGNILYLGQSGQLDLEFQGTSSVPAPDHLEIDGFQIGYLGPSTRMSIVNGRMSSSVTHMYRIVPLRTGTFHIDPITVTYKGDTYRSNSLNIEVRDSASAAGTPGRQQDQRQINLSDRVFIKMHAPKDRFYINEIVPLTIKLYVSGVSVRDIQYPEYFHEGFSREQFDKPLQYEEVLGGLGYNVVEFRTSLFATRDGDFRLGPANLKARIVSPKSRRRLSPLDDFFGRDPFDSFFGNYEARPIEVTSEEIKVKVLPLPLQGRPSDFKGAVGNFTFDLEVSPTEVSAGDPVTLKMIISGEGNFNTVASPVLKSTEGFKSYDPLVKEEGKTKVFEQVLIPASVDADRIPETSFSFFNTQTGQYQTITRGGMALQVRRPERKEEITILDAPGSAERRIVKEQIGRDIIYIKESPGTLRERGRYLYNNSLFLLLQLLPVIAFIAVSIVNKKKRRLSTDIGYARRLAAPKKARKTMKEAEVFLKNRKPEDFYDAIFKAVREYIGDRFHVPSGGITAESAGELIKAKGIDEDIPGRLKNVFTECDVARYAPSGFDKEKMEHTLRELREIIDYLERYKG